MKQSIILSVFHNQISCNLTYVLIGLLAHINFTEIDRSGLTILSAGHIAGTNLDVVVTGPPEVQAHRGVFPIDREVKGLPFLHIAAVQGLAHSGLPLYVIGFGHVADADEAVGTNAASLGVRMVAGDDDRSCRRLRTIRISPHGSSGADPRQFSRGHILAGIHILPVVFRAVEHVLGYKGIRRTRLRAPGGDVDFRTDMEVGVITSAVAIERRAVAHIDIGCGGAASGKAAAGLLSGIAGDQHVVQVQPAVVRIVADTVGVDTAAAVGAAMASIVDDAAFGDGRGAVGLDEDTAAALSALVAIDGAAGHHQTGSLAHAAHVSANSDTAARAANSAAAAGRCVVPDFTAGQVHCRAGTNVDAAAVSLLVIRSVVFDHTAGHVEHRTAAADLDTAAVHTGVPGNFTAIHGHVAAGVDTAGAVRITIAGAVIVADDRSIMNLQVGLGVDDRRSRRDAGFAAAVQHHVLQAQTAVVLHHDALEARITVQHDGLGSIRAFPGLAVRSYSILDIGNLVFGDGCGEGASRLIDRDRRHRRVHGFGDRRIRHDRGLSVSIHRQVAPFRSQLGKGLVGFFIAAVAGFVVAVHTVQVEAGLRIILMIVDFYIGVCRVQIVRESNVRTVKVHVHVGQVRAGIADQPDQITRAGQIAVGNIDLLGRIAATQAIAAHPPRNAREHIGIELTDLVGQVSTDRRVVVLHKGSAVRCMECIVRHIAGIVDAQILDAGSRGERGVRDVLFIFTGKDHGLQSGAATERRRMDIRFVDIVDKGFQRSAALERAHPDTQLAVNVRVLFLAEAYIFQGSAAAEEILGRFVTAARLLEGILDTVGGEYDVGDIRIARNLLIAMQRIVINSDDRDFIRIVRLAIEYQFSYRVFRIAVVNAGDHRLVIAGITAQRVPELVVMVFISKHSQGEGAHAVHMESYVVNGVICPGFDRGMNLLHAFRGLVEQLDRILINLRGVRTDCPAVFIRRTVHTGQHINCHASHLFAIGGDEAEIEVLDVVDRIRLAIFFVPGISEVLDICVFVDISLHQHRAQRHAVGNTGNGHGAVCAFNDLLAGHSGSGSQRCAILESILFNCQIIAAVIAIRAQGHRGQSGVAGKSAFFDVGHTAGEFDCRQIGQILQRIPTDNDRLFSINGQRFQILFSIEATGSKFQFFRIERQSLYIAGRNGIPTDHQLIIAFKCQFNTLQRIVHAQSPGIAGDMQIHFRQLRVIGDRGAACVLQIDRAVARQFRQLRREEDRGAVQTERSSAFRVREGQFLQTAVIIESHTLDSGDGIGLGRSFFFAFLIRQRDKRGHSFNAPASITVHEGYDFRLVVFDLVQEYAITLRTVRLLILIQQDIIVAVAETNISLLVQFNGQLGILLVINVFQVFQRMIKESAVVFAIIPRGIKNFTVVIEYGNLQVTDIIHTIVCIVTIEAAQLIQIRQNLG